MRNTQALLILLLIFLVVTPLTEPVLGVIQPLGAATFASGTYVVPMDNKQADRIHVYGFIHEFLKNSSNNNLARIIEPPDATLQTALTPSGEVYQGGPFLIDAGFSSGVNLMLANSTFSKVTVTRLTAPFTSNRVFFVRSPTKILVISDGTWGKTYLTLQRMGISYDQVTPTQIMANAPLINQYTLIVLDSPGWYGTPSKYDPAHQAEIEAVYNTMRLRVQAGAEAMYTDAANLDLNSTFPGYINLALEGESGSWHSTVYNPPKGGFDSEFPSQYYNPPPNPNNVKILTEEGAGLWVPTSVPSAHAQDVRVLMDSSNYGIPSKYAILAYYFPFGRGIVEGLALQPYEQLYPNYADQNGYYATYEIYGNKFVEGLGQDFTLAATPTTETVSQGQTASYTVTVTSLSEFNSAVNLQVTGGLPAGTQASIVPSSVTPSPDGSVVATLTIPTSLSTPLGSYNVTITGSSSLPLITRSIVVGLTVAPAPADFTVNVSPSLLVINQASCGNFTITVTSIGNFSSPINLTLSGIPEHVTWKYVPNPITPPIGGTVVSVLSICTEANTPPGNYTITLFATGGGLTHTATALLRVPVPPVPSVNWLIYVLILGMLLLAIGIALLALLFSRKGPRRMRAVPAPFPVVVRAPPRAAYVLPLPTVRCRYCGRIMPLTSVYCPFCGRPQVVLAPPQVRVRRRLSGNGLIGVILTIVSGILVLLNSAALLSPSFYALWSSIFFWLPSIPQSYEFALGMIIGLTLIFGAIIMAMGHGAIADVIIFPFAVFSLIIGGGFIAGFILGVLGGIIGALRREP